MSLFEPGRTLATQSLWNEVQPEPHTDAGRRSATLTIPYLLDADLDLKVAAASPWTLSPFRRVLDVTAASLALLLLWPVLLVIGLWVRLDSDGPVVFRQRRMGRYGNLFTIYKFRTMDVKTNHRDFTVTRHGDRRVTRVGTRLRKYKLDELPQLWNVLMGDMSLIGPRPKLPHHETLEMPFRPGLTGAATLIFRCEEEMLREIPEDELEIFCVRRLTPCKAKLDSEYRQAATLISDLKLLYKTASACASGRKDPPVDFSSIC
jgi:lipopolysaccharide/colanic/teichoic acid biosynthesis glycosyltransferase